MKVNDSLKFRLATFEELDLIVQLDSKVNLTNWNKEQYLFCFNNVSQYLYVLDDKTQGIIASIAFSMVLTESEVLQIWVKHGYQNQGYGKIILMQTLMLLEANSVKKVCLEVRENNESAIIFYTKFGFNMVGRRKNYYNIGNNYSDALVMCLEM